MGVDFSKPINTFSDVDDITEVLEVQFPSSIKCEIDLTKRQVTIPRMELKLKGNRPISGGWTSKIAMIQGIDRRYTLRDAIVLPTIAPKTSAPVEGGTATIPKDLVKSEDEWNLEWYIVDPMGNSALLYKSPPASLVGQ